MEPNIPVLICAVVFAALFVYICRKPMKDQKSAVVNSLAAADQNTRAIMDNTAAIREHTEVLRQYIALNAPDQK
jgi:hypothetical protein